MLISHIFLYVDNFVLSRQHMKLNNSGAEKCEADATDLPLLDSLFARPSTAQARALMLAISRV